MSSRRPVTGHAEVDRGLRFVGRLPDGRELWERPDFFGRPPIGPALLGRRSSSAGRGHRETHTSAARAARFALCWRAFELRRSGATIRAVAGALGISRSLAGRWLRGVLPGGAVCARQQLVTLPRPAGTGAGLGGRIA
jgi:hypothetical protein